MLKNVLLNKVWVQLWPDNCLLEFGGMFQENVMSDKILNNFHTVTFIFLVCGNYLEFGQTSSIFKQPTIIVFSGQLSGHNCVSGIWYTAYQ